MEKILIGKIVSAVGVKGEVKVYNYSDQDRYESLKHLYLEKINIKGEAKGNLLEFKVEKARTAGNTAVVKLEGINDRNTAETFINSSVYIMEEDLRELPKGSYYIRDLIGCLVYDIKSDAIIGTISDVDQSGAQDNYEVKLESGKTTLIPAVKEFIKEVDIEKKTVKVSLIPGFIDSWIEA